MLLRFTGFIKDAFDYREGISQKSNLRWERITVWVEEQNGGQYPSGILVDVWKPALIEWMRRNVGAVITVEYSPRVEVYNEVRRERNRCYGCVHDGVKVGLEESKEQPVQARPTQVQAQPQPQVQGNGVYRANNIPSIQEGQEEDLPF